MELQLLRCRVRSVVGVQNKKIAAKGFVLIKWQAYTLRTCAESVIVLNYLFALLSVLAKTSFSYFKLNFK